MMKLQCPICEGVIEPLTEVLPITWNFCCSVDCARMFDGYCMAVDELHEIIAEADLRIRQHRWNEWEMARLTVELENKQLTCQHVWTCTMGIAHENIITSDAEISRDYRIHVCNRCQSWRKGQLINERVRSIL